jgi:hypothetical protein
MCILLTFLLIVISSSVLDRIKVASCFLACHFKFIKFVVLIFLILKINFMVIQLFIIS